MRKLLSVPLCVAVLPGLLPGLLSVTACATASSGAALKTTFDSGVAAYDAGDYPKAYKIWHSIDDEDLAAMRNEAMLLRQGTGVAKDPKKAEELYEMAAEAGLPTAQADLADMLLKGEAGPPDPARALPLLEAAAAADHPVAQYELAEMYETGQGGLVPQDMKTARTLYASAASHGMKQAQARLDQLGPAPAETAAPADQNLRLIQPAPIAPAPGTSASNPPPIRSGQP